MSSAIQNLQKAILDPSQSLTQLLRQTKMIAGELNLTDVEKWVDLELRGYPADVEPPALRSDSMNTVRFLLTTFKTVLGNLIPG